MAHHAGVTRLLIERGADPNDPEVVYHTPEDWDLAALKAVVETGRLTPESLSLMLMRKADWHHAEGVKYLLEHGADPNASWKHGLNALQQAIVRDNDRAKDSTALHVAAWRAAHDTARLLIERGADVNARDLKGHTPLLMAVKACVDSYWTEWRKPDTVAALLGAGATTEGVPDVSGYDEVDALLKSHRETHRDS